MTTSSSSVFLDGRVLVGGGSSGSCNNFQEEYPTAAATAAAEEASSTLLISNVSLSFWGGIDPVTGIVMDASHPLYGQNVTNKILCLPSGRGSCTASQVLLELLLNDNAPQTIVLRDVDGLVCVGAIVAQEIFVSNNNNHNNNMDIVCLGETNFQTLLDFSSTTATTTSSDDEDNIDTTQSSDSGAVLMMGRVTDNGRLEVWRKCDHHHPSLNNNIISTRTDSSSENEVGTTTDDMQQQQQQQSTSIIGNEVTPSSSSSVMRTTTSDHHDDDQQSQQKPLYSDVERELLERCKTKAERMALKVIFRYAHILKNDDAVHYRPIVQAHIDGCTYIGPGGLEFVQQLVRNGGHVRVPTTLNSVSTDRQNWQTLGVPTDYAQNSIALGDAYLQLGCQPSFTCAPYLLLPSETSLLGQDVAWGESNAVVYANSVLGARTEKYADYLDICCAISGIVPMVGMHVPENRRPQVVLHAQEVMTQLQAQLTSDDNKDQVDLDLLFPTLGHLCGTLSDGKVPLLLGLQDWNEIVSTDHLKAFCAAFGTTASSPLIHIAGITPEANGPQIIEEFVNECRDNVKEITMDQLDETFASLNTEKSEEAVDLVALGNPHLSVTECKDLAALIQNSSCNNDSSSSSTKHANTRMMACMSRSVHSQADPQHVQTMEDFGVEFVFDTCWCMLLDPPVIPRPERAVILTNSGKYAHYGPGLTSKRFRFGSMADCVHAARTGRLHHLNAGHNTSFLQQRRQYGRLAARSLVSLLRHRWR